jgi:hypothetical protein
LLKRPHLTCDRLNKGLLAFRQGRDDRIGQLSRRSGAQPPRLDPPQHRAGLAQRGLGRDCRVDWAVDGDHKASTDELVQLDVVDMATLAELRSVLDDEDVVMVGADLGHGIALDAGLDGQGVEAEHLRQHSGGLFVTDGDIDPDESVVASEQPLQLPHRMLLDAVIGHKANVHPPATSWEPWFLRRSGAAVTAPTQQPGRARRGLSWDQTRAARGLRDRLAAAG